MGEEPALVEAADQLAQGVLHLGGNVQHFSLAQKMFLQRSFNHQGVEEMLAALGVLGGEGLVAGALGEVVAPVVAQLG